MVIITFKWAALKFLEADIGSRKQEGMGTVKGTGKQRQDAAERVKGTEKQRQAAAAISR